MNKHLLFLLLIVIAIFGATRLFQPPVVDATLAQAGSAPATQTSPATATSGRAQEKSGIEVSVEAVEQRGETTVLTLALNNHQFDLSLDAIYDNATLNGIPSQSHAFLGEPSGGGHHAEVEVVFPQTTEGSFIITPIEGTTFTFDTLW